MNAIAIDSKIYDNASAYAKRHKTSLRHIVESYIVRLMAEDSLSAGNAKDYYISPAVKALETGFKTPEDMSVDYKKEIAESRGSKYL